MRQRATFGRRDLPETNSTRKPEFKTRGNDYRGLDEETSILADIKGVAFKDWKNTTATVMMAVATFLVTLAVVMPAPEISAEERARRAQVAAEKAYEHNCGERQVPSAFVMLQRPVRNQLKSPSTASFPYKPLVGVSIGDCKFRIVSYVDAQNVFGGTVRATWSGVIQYIPETNLWRTIEVNVDG